jgi:hypothetical protein
MYKIERTDEEIDLVLNEAMENEHKFPGMTYMQGVKEAIDWITGQTDSNPVED